MNKGDCFVHIESKDEISKTETLIEIPFEEYKELLIIKGKYEELKSQQITPLISNPRITYTDLRKDIKYPYEVTCDKK